MHLGDARLALSQLVSEQRRFDAIVVDIADTVLDRADVEHLHLGYGGINGGLNGGISDVPDFFLERGLHIE